MLYLLEKGKTECWDIADEISSQMPLNTLDSLVKRKLAKKTYKIIKTHNMFYQPLDHELTYYELTSKGKKIIKEIL